MGYIHITRLERASDGGWFLGFRCGDDDTFNTLKGRIKDLPMYSRKWHPDKRAWWVSDIGIRMLKRIYPEIADALRAVEDDDREDTRRSYRSSYQSRESQQSSLPLRIEDAYKTLHLLPSAPLVVIQAAYRALSKISHPDIGGSTETMKRINNAHDLLRDWVKGKSA